MATKYYERMDVGCRTPLGKGELALLFYYKIANAYGHPLIPRREQLAYRMDSDHFILFDSMKELTECLSDHDVPHSIRSHPEGYANFLAAYYNLGRVLCGRESIVAEYAERVIDLDDIKPKIVSDALMFWTLEFQEPFPKLFRHTVALDSLLCQTEYMVDSDKEYHRIILE